MQICGGIALVNILPHVSMQAMHNWQTVHDGLRANKINTCQASPSALASNTVRFRPSFKVVHVFLLAPLRVAKVCPDFLSIARYDWTHAFILDFLLRRLLFTAKPMRRLRTPSTTALAIFHHGARLGRKPAPIPMCSSKL